MASAPKEAHAAVMDAAKAGSLQQLQEAMARLPGDTPVHEVSDSRGRTPLHVAAQSNHEGLCKHLIDSMGCDVNVQDEDGDTPLALASFAGHEPVVDALLERGADANRHKQGAAGPLHRAALAGHAGVAQKLLDKGADVHGGAGGGAPVAWAAGAGQAGVLDVLLKAGADPNGAGSNGVTPLLMAASVGSTPAVRSLVGAGAAVDTRGPGGVTALHVAANSGSEDMVNCLLEAGAAPDAADEQGRTPAKVAAAAGHRSIVAALLGRTGAGAGAPAGAKGGKGGGGGGAAAAAVSAEEVEELIQAVQREKEEAEARRAAEPSLTVPEAEDPNPEAAEEERKKGNELFVGGQYEAAAEQYSASLRHSTSTAATWANRAACYLKLGKDEEALADARVARALDPKYVKAWFREGQAAERLERWEDAALGYYEAYMLQPPDSSEAEEFALMMKRVIEKGRKEQQAAQQGVAK